MLNVYARPIGVILLLLLAPPAAGQAGDGPELIPREVFFGNPDRANVRISPDGTKLAYLAPDNGVLNVWVEDVDGRGSRCVTSSTARPIQRFQWAHNGEQILYLQDGAGDENHVVRAVDIASGLDRAITPTTGVQARIVAADRRFPDEVLVAMNDRVPQLHDVHRVNTRTGDRTLVLQNDEGFVSMIADADYVVRIATRLDAAGGSRSYLRDTDDGPWYELARWSMADAATSGPIGLSGDGRRIYLTDARATDTAGLYAFVLPTESDDGSYARLAASPRADVSDVVMHPVTQRPQAVAFDYARREWTVLDPAIEADWKALREVADGEMEIVSRDHDDARWIVSFVRDDGPTEFHLYDRRSRAAELLFTNRRDLVGRTLAKMKPVEITARDGLTLVSYLTTPPGAEPRELPTVLLVHGGPWARDSWGYDPIHQWLANRGYAVLSVNFRGSTGFGKRFLNAGNREWAGRMQDDLIDAVNWAVRDGVADPDRVAIMGGSYGGYATLVGLTFTPEFFAAGVDIVGPSHVRTLLESIPPYWEPLRSLFDARVGSLDRPDYLDGISPLTRVDAIKRPLLIGQGANDPRVREAESRQIVEAMQAKGLPVTYVVFPDEGHGFARPENNLAFFALTEAFLAEHLGGRCEPVGDALSRSSAQLKAGADLITGVSR